MSRGLMSRGLVLPALCLLFLFIPAAARANAGTPLMWAGMLHLFVLNLVIGILEGSLLAKLFRLPWPKSQFLIPANYFSMIIGWLLLRAAWTPLEQLLPGQAPLFKGATLLCILGCASWLLSIVLEWPFCAWVLYSGANARGHRLWRDSWRATVVAQTASYALLVPFYLLVSPISIYTIAKIQHSLTFVRPSLAMVYYINPHDGSLWRIRTDGTGKGKVLEAHIDDKHARLFVRKNPKSHLCDIGVVSQEKPLLSGVGTACAPTNEDNRRPFGPPADLRADSQPALTVRTAFWPAGGITVIHGDTSKSLKERTVYTLAFETPFEQWVCRSATVLPNDQVVFAMGSDPTNTQILILDMAHRELGFLAMGQGPVVVLQPQ